MGMHTIIEIGTGAQREIKAADDWRIRTGMRLMSAAAYNPEQRIADHCRWILNDMTYTWPV